MYVGFLSVCKHHSLISTAAVTVGHSHSLLSFAKPLVWYLTPMIVFFIITEIRRMVIENSMSVSAESFIPFNPEHLIITRFVLLTILCLRM